MKIADHIAKAEHIERTMMGKLDRDKDYEIYVEGCMLAGTHFLNAILHKHSITDECFDLLHSDKPSLQSPIPSELQPLFSAMKFIEDLRPCYLRGMQPWQPDHGKLCWEKFSEVKKFFQKN